MDPEPFELSSAFLLVLGACKLHSLNAVTFQRFTAPLVRVVEKAVC